MVRSRELNHHEVVAVDQFDVGGSSAEGGVDLLGFESGDAGGVGGGVVAQAPGELVAAGIAQGHNIALAEVARHAPDANWQ